jgi:hypothetical protein
MRRVLLTVVAGVLLALPVTTADARVTGYGWADMLALGNAIETHGVYYGGRHKDIDNALCLGLRRYGVRTIDYEDYYHRFKCSLSGADEHFYTAAVLIVRSSGPRFSWRVLSIRRDF